MSTATPLRQLPLRHIEVDSGEWFFMNHLRNHGEASVHDHNYLELAFVVHGKARHHTISGESPARKGDVYILPVGSWHGYVSCQNLEIVNCLLSPALLRKELAWMGDDPEWRSLLGLGEVPGCSEIRFLKLDALGLRKVKSLLGDLQYAYKRGAGRGEMLGHLLLLLSMLRQSTGRRRVLSQGVGMHPSVRRALQYLNEDPAREWTLGVLASNLRLNPSYLVRLFRTHTGLAPMKYLANLRAGQAATLLLSGVESVGEIGEKVGWPDPKQFSRSFRQHFGMSASAYRKKMLRPFRVRLSGEGLPGLGKKNIPVAERA